MSDEPSGWPQDVLDALPAFRLGTIVEGVRFPFYGAHAGGLPLAYPPEDAVIAAEQPATRDLGFLEYELDTADGDPPRGVITSQTCDVCEEGTPLQPWVQVSPLQLLPDDYAGQTLPAFLYRANPPDLRPGVWVIDLRIEVAIEKDRAAGAVGAACVRHGGRRGRFC